MPALRAHAMQLAHASITDDILSLQNAREGEQSENYKRRKEHILTKLKRAAPGATASLNAVRTADGTITADTSAIASTLRDHWGHTFQGQPIDEGLLQQWLHSLPHLGSQAETHTSSTGPGDESQRAPPRVSAEQQQRRRHPLPERPRDWKIRRKDIRRAVKGSGDSAPGPDGIPYGAWRALGEMGIDILWSVAEGLESEDASPLLHEAYSDVCGSGGHLYNLGNLICLPKKAAGLDDVGEEYFDAEGTRPLSVVNCDNRIVANAARLRWEPHFGHWVSQMQQGFLRGRSIMLNLVDLDFESMKVALRRPDGALVLFDFRSAFPSVSQEYIHKVLDFIGLPPSAKRLVQSLYNGNRCQIHFRGETLEGFPMRSGVRQGCPLSPLLYAIVADLLLETIAMKCPEALVKAFADDTAVVVPAFWQDVGALQEVFNEFEKVSGLSLNLAKCVIIPLSPSPLGAFKAKMEDVAPDWSNMSIARRGTYLGFAVGPEKGDSSWTKASTKFLARAKAWGGRPLGLQFSALTYNTFALSVLGYVAQLERPPDWVLDMERSALRAVAPGPGNWATPDDLWRLRESFGVGISFKSIAAIAKAAQLRVRIWDQAGRDNTVFREKVRELRGLLRAPTLHDVRAQWADWFQRSFLLCLADNEQHFTSDIGPIQLVYDSIIAWKTSPSQDPRPHARIAQPHTRACNRHGRGGGDEDRADHRRESQNLLRLKIGFQRAAYGLVMRHTQPDPENRVRQKLARWNLDDPARHGPEAMSARQLTPNWIARRTLHNMYLLSTLVPPRVSAAVFSTIWNRWATDRRFQKRTLDGAGRCRLGCGGRYAEDSIEHYGHCETIREVGIRQLHLDPDGQLNLRTFMQCNPRIRTKEQLTAAALLVYAAYRAFNHYRHNTPPPSGQVAHALRQWVREGAMGHKQATSVLDALWARPCPSTPLPPTPANLQSPANTARKRLRRSSQASGTLSTH